MKPHSLQYLLVALLTLSSCHQEKTYRIGVSQCSSDDWRYKMNDEMEREVLFHPEARLEIRSADNDNARQIADIKYFTDNAFDIILVAPNEADAITPAINQAYARGIPVVLFDRYANDCDYTVYVDTDNAAIGQAAARYAAALLGEKGNIIEIKGLKGSTPGIERCQGFDNEIFDCFPQAHIVGSGYGDWNKDKAAEVTDSLLNIYKDVQLIYAHNDRMAIGASEVVRRKGLKDIKIIGVDAVPSTGIQAVADGVIDATFLYPTEGHFIIRLALQILKGETPQRIVKLPVSSAVDKTNADILLRQNESVEEEGTKMRLLKESIDEYWSRHSAQTALFYACVVILILISVLLFILLKAYWQHQKHQRQLMEQNLLLEKQRDVQRDLNEKLKEATASKLAFFTNVSHDLRTPLTLISEPVSQLASAKNLSPEQHTLASLARKNVAILRRLVSEILDFRKYEGGHLALRLSRVNLSERVTEWVQAFKSVSHKRDIKLSSDIQDNILCDIDEEKLERVLYNLLSNAFKYTQDNGSIHVTLSAADGHFTLSVKDNGVGMKPQEAQRAFDRFYRAEDVAPEGSGIGLALVKAFVEMHGGRVWVESEVGKGSVFSVEIPIKESPQAAQTELPPDNAEGMDTAVSLDRIETDETAMDEDKPLLLVVDDNEDLRELVRVLLGDNYNVICAADGAEGLRKAVKYVPDLIICDVMMPVMDGWDCCSRIKGELSTSHIPVLLLTACSTDEQKAKGFSCNAYGYLSKPFDGAVLRAQCASLIENRRRIKELWSEEPASPTPQSRPKSAGIDDEFYLRLTEKLTARLSEPELSVEDLASEMNLGRSQLYRKVKALTNYSPVELLRSLRLKQARKLLTTTELSISEIAYDCGFASPAYFTKCYRETFGQTPSELRNDIGK